MDHRVSFVIPARDEDPAVVTRTLDGILATTVGHREIIVVDDASAQPIKVSGPGVTLIRNREPIGACRSRILGAKSTTGDVLVWLDAHMTFGEGWLAAMLAEVDSGALLCAPWRDYARLSTHAWGSDFGWRDAGDDPHGVSAGFTLSLRSKPPRGHCVRVPMIIGACYMMRRDAYERTGGFCPLFRIYGGDEPDLSARTWLSGGTVRCVTRAQVGHLDRTQFPYSVSVDEVVFNQVVTIRSLFEESTARLLEEFLQPLSANVARWLAQTDVAGWRTDVQQRRRMTDADFFRQIAPRVPLSFGRRVGLRRGHFPAFRFDAALANEERALEHLVSDADPQQFATALGRTHRLVHAGVVAWMGQVIILPGGTSTGRRGLVAALVAAGATLYSETYAVLDSAGLVHAYPRRETNGTPADPLPVAVVASIEFVPGRSWRLCQVSAAEAALDLLANAAGGRDATIFVAVNRVVERTLALAGRRGPPGPMARALLRFATPGFAATEEPSEAAGDFPNGR